MEDKTFDWLKHSTKGLRGSTTFSIDSEAIAACLDPEVLMRGVLQDFNAILHETRVSVANSALSGNESMLLPPEGSLDVLSDTNRLDDLTARLDRIKTLLYEERSFSFEFHHDWTPSIARGVVDQFTGSLSSLVVETAVLDEYKDTNPVPHNALLPRMINNLTLLPFEARKSMSAIFNYLLVCGLDGPDARLFSSVSSIFAEYVLRCADGVVGQLARAHDCDRSTAIGRDGGGGVGGGSYVDITLLCGSMLRSSLRHAAIYDWILSAGNCERLVYPFLEKYVHNPNFDVSSDALETVRVMFTGNAAANTVPCIEGDALVAEYHRQIMESIASDFLNRDYADIVDNCINKKCLSPNANYMTRRMTLQLLSSILLNRANYNVMMMYISSSRNLVTILCLLRDQSPHITLDAFQVFKIFVANPNKVSDYLKNEQKKSY
jgi:calcium binding protein 39